jgi:glutathione synthase/RimK-type ligase-like ATP-grasp enzyme
MKIAIHHKENDFSSKWINYCKEHKIDYKIVNCYDNDIIDQVKDCDALMWHFNQANPKDVLFAKQLLFALQSAGKKVFPNFHTAWHFDDKVGQKYLLEAIGAPLVPSYVFYDKQDALQWVEEATFPKVFKLRRGAGSAHVKLAKNKSEAAQLVNKAFSEGFSQYDKVQNLKDRWYKYRNDKTGLWNVAKGLLRFAKTTEFAKTVGPEKGYSYFQDFIPGNDSDIRVIVIDGKAFAIKRLVREGDFRASGSGHVLYDKHHFDEETVRLSFEIAEKIGSQCLAIDYVYQEDTPFVVELSFGFIKEVYYACTGYWDQSLKWHNGPFDAQGWMVESMLKKNPNVAN